MRVSEIQNPTVSIVIPSYNHEKFINDCINSVLNQSFQDFEIIITDDGSPDRTFEKISAFNDRRIRLYLNSRNRGACFTANRCIENSTGKYIAMLSSDDVWLPDKLQKQVDYLEGHPDIHAVFTKVNWINEEGNLIRNPDFLYNNIFEVKNRSRFEWLNYFFFSGNCLCHPSSLVRRAVYNEIGLFNPMFANLPDFDFWVRLCLKYEIYILDERLINFRHSAKETSASSNSPSNIIRAEFEVRHVLEHYKSIRDVETFKKVFPTSHQFNDLEVDDLHFILGKIAIETGINYKVLWGQDLLLETLSDPKQAKRILEKFNFDYPDFYKITNSVEIFSNLDFKFPHKRSFATKLLRRIRLKREMTIIAKTSLFDKEYYLTHYPDVAQTGIDPIKHYLLYGSDEGRNPSKSFNTIKYLTRYPKVQHSGLNPLIHFILHSKKKDRNPF